MVQQQQKIDWACSESRGRMDRVQRK